MKKFPFAALAVFLLASLFMNAQAAAAGDNTRPHINGVNLSGKLSNDGKVLITDDDNSWNVSNPDALKGLEGRYLTVKCRMDLNKRALKVLSIVEQPETKHAGNRGDSAFHR